MAKVFTRIGISDRAKAAPDWLLTPECLLLNAGGDILMVITVENAVNGYPSVEFTVLRTPSGQVMLFAQNIDDLEEYSNYADTKRFYQIAKAKWIECFPEVDFPTLEDCQSFWRKWLTNNLVTSS